MIRVLVGGRPTPLKNDGVRQWGWDDIPDMKWKITNVPNHQPDPTRHFHVVGKLLAAPWLPIE